MSKVKIRYHKDDVLFIIHNECIYHVKNIAGGYWSKKKNKPIIVEFKQRDKRG